MSSVWTLKFLYCDYGIYNIIFKCTLTHTHACPLMCNEGRNKDTLSNIVFSKIFKDLRTNSVSQIALG